MIKAAGRQDLQSMTYLEVLGLTSHKIDQLAVPLFKELESSGAPMIVYISYIAMYYTSTNKTKDVTHPPGQ